MKSKVISTRFNEDEVQLLHQFADDIEMKISDFMRTSVRLVLDHRKSLKETEPEQYYSGLF